MNQAIELKIQTIHRRPQFLEGPWSFQPDSESTENEGWLRDASGTCLGYATLAEIEPLLKKVNAHDDLVAALKDALREIKDWKEGKIGSAGVLRAEARLDVALAKAGL